MRRAVRTIPVIVFCSTAVLAQSDSTSSQANPFGLIGLIAVILCIVRRNDPIGGWLMYFFVQSFAAFLRAVIALATSLPAYLPGYGKSTAVYVLFLWSHAPDKLMCVCLAVAVANTWRSEAAEDMARLKTILWLYLLFAAVAVGIDCAYFEPSILTASVNLIFAGLFQWYLHASDRVERVFVTHDWAGQKPPSLLDSKPQSGVIYTDIELEAFREREPKPPEKQP
jgi:uncharacterized membrane protein YozB (DUF420 family)